MIKKTKNPAYTQARDAARDFAQRNHGLKKENAEAQTFVNEFFAVFGLDRRKVAFFEHRVRAEGTHEALRVDCLMPGVLLIEMKSAGRDLDVAFEQAKGYIKRMNDSEGAPHYVMLSDFQNIVLYDIQGKANKPLASFRTADLPKHIEAFSFLLDPIATQPITQEDLNILASLRLAGVHDELEAQGYKGHALQLLMARILFCLFAEDTGIFPENSFTQLVEHSPVNGEMLGMQLKKLFETLNENKAQRKKRQKGQYDHFPYVNGGLFAEEINDARFNETTYDALLNACYFDWGNIDPAIFGALFQGLEDRDERREGGQHYTSEKNILKALNPLLLDELRDELQSIQIKTDDVFTGYEKRNVTTRKDSGTTLRRNNIRAVAVQLIERIRALTLLDPACGCGNFLIVAYRELRRLELAVMQQIKRLHDFGEGQQQSTLFEVEPLVKLSNFHGIEIKEWPAQIANVAMIITQHQMNMEFVASNISPTAPNLLPLSQQANIVCANALKTDWNKVIPASSLNYIVGNPPFVGAKYQSDKQRSDTAAIAGKLKNGGLLDYVTNWFIKAADMMDKNPTIRAALVSTNSITQGEQVGVLWTHLDTKKVHIHFAHRTFAWWNEARGKAAVHCVIIGFDKTHQRNKTIYHYATPKAEPIAVPAEKINAYLLDAHHVLILNRSKPLCDVPEIGIGNKPIDDGNYLFTPEQKAEFLRIEPQAAPYFRRWLGADEFINGYERWCLWLGECTHEQLESMPEAMKRVNAVRKFRLASKSAPTQKIADKPTRFHVENMPSKPFLVLPETSSERRKFIPIGFVAPDILCSNAVKISQEATIYQFGVLTSTMHNAWMRAIGGRLESRYRYSVGIVYNNFPWPAPTEAQRTAIEAAAQGVLDARQAHPDLSLATLYNPDTMPKNLEQAHAALDKAVDAAYRYNGATDDEPARMETLIRRYFLLTEKASQPNDE